MQFKQLLHVEVAYGTDTF